MKTQNSYNGEASLVMVLLIGFVAMVSAIASSSLSVENVQIEETQHAADRAWYASWAGIDEIMYRLRARQVFPSVYTENLTLDNGATVSATITGDANNKIIESTGYAAGMVKNIRVSASYSLSKASFIYAVQSGTGGFELEGQTTVKGVNNSSGNVYSNGDVLGTKATSGTAGSKILGSIWAVGNVSGLSSPTSGGVFIQKNVWANNLTACLVNGNVIADSPPSNCPYSGSLTLAPPPPPVSLSAIDGEFWKNIAQSGGVWNGNCNIKSGDASDCSAGTGKIGNLKIVGNLSVASGLNFTFTGPVWVQGNINISQNNIVSTDESVGTTSVVVIASDPANMSVNGTITTSSNVTFQKNSQGAGLIFVSENTGDNCANAPAVNITSNTATVVFIAVDGCVNIGSNSVISGILAKKIHIKNNSTVIYDPSLAKAIVDPGSGGWAINSVNEY